MNFPPKAFASPASTWTKISPPLNYALSPPKKISPFLSSPRYSGHRWRLQHHLPLPLRPPPRFLAPYFFTPRRIRQHRQNLSRPSRSSPNRRRLFQHSLAPTKLASPKPFLFPARSTTAASSETNSPTASPSFSTAISTKPPLPSNRSLLRNPKTPKPSTISAHSTSARTISNKPGNS